MKLILKPLVNLEELLQVQDHPEYILIDVRSGENGEKNYNQEHLEKAIYVNLETDLSDIQEDTSNGGRHPLPPLHLFSHLLGTLGITPKSHVVVYDDTTGGNGAARFWWMLRSLGHKKVQVLDGGFPYAQRCGFSMSNSPTLPISCEDYPITQWKLPMVMIDEVEAASLSNEKVIIDVRSNERYRGLTEPLDLVAGHIPNAINIPYTTNLTPEGVFLSKRELKAKYKKLFFHHTKDQIVFHCGSGVTACHSLLAIDYAGLPIPNLYVGSWSEWYKNEKTVVTDL